MLLSPIFFSFLNFLSVFSLVPHLLSFPYPIPHFLLLLMVIYICLFILIIPFLFLFPILHYQLSASYPCTIIPMLPSLHLLILFFQFLFLSSFSSPLHYLSPLSVFFPSFNSSFFCITFYCSFSFMVLLSSSSQSQISLPTATSDTIPNIQGEIPNAFHLSQTHSYFIPAAILGCRTFQDDSKGFQTLFSFFSVFKCCLKDVPSQIPTLVSERENSLREVAKSEKFLGYVSSLVLRVFFTSNSLANRP